MCCSQARHRELAKEKAAAQAAKAAQEEDAGYPVDDEYCGAGGDLDDRAPSARRSDKFKKQQHESDYHRELQRYRDMYDADGDGLVGHHEKGSGAKRSVSPSDGPRSPRLAQLLFLESSLITYVWSGLHGIVN